MYCNKYGHEIPKKYNSSNNVKNSNKKKILFFLLILIMNVSFANNVFANDTMSNKGLDITIETDKDEYEKNDEIVVNYTLENNNTLSLENVSLSIVGPEGYSVTTEKELEWKNIAAGEKVNVSVELVQKKTNAILGDGGISPVLWIVIVGIILIVAVVLFLVFKGKKKKIITGASILFFVIFIGSLSITDIYADEKAELKKTETKNIKLDDSEIDLTAILSYSMEKEVEVEYTRQEWVNMLLDLGNYPEDYNYSLQEPDAIADREFFAVSAVRWLGYEKQEKDSIEFCDDYNDIDYPLQVVMALDIGLIELDGDNFNPSGGFTNRNVNNMLVQKEYINSLREITENKENVTFQENGEATGEENDIFETVDYIEAEGKGNLDFTSFIPEEGITAEVTSDDNNRLTIKADLGDGWSTEAVLTINEANADYVIDMDLNSKLDEYNPTADIKNLYINFNSDIVTDVKLINAQEEPSTVEKTIKLGRVPVSGLEWLDIYMDVELVINAEGTGSLQLGIKGYNTIHIVDNNIILEKEFELFPKVDLIDDASTQVKVSYELALLNQVLIDVEFANTLKGYSDVYSRYNGLECMDISWRVERNLSMLQHSKLKDFIDVDIDYAAIEITRDEDSGWEHIENSQAVEQCTFVDNSEIIQKYATAVFEKMSNNWLYELVEVELTYLNDDEIYDVIATYMNPRGSEESVWFIYNGNGVSEIHKAIHAAGRALHTFYRHNETGKLRAIAYWWDSSRETYTLYDENEGGEIVSSTVCGVESKDLLNLYTSDTYNYIESQGNVDDATYKAYVDSLYEGYTKFEPEILHGITCNQKIYDTPWNFVRDFLNEHF